MGDDPIDRAVRLHGEALAALEDERLDAALTAAAGALALFERESGPGHPDVANVLNCLARVHERRTDWREAEACSRRSVAIVRRVREQAAGADLDRLQVQSLTAHGEALRALGRYAEAEERLREALAGGEALGEADEDLVTALNALGVLCKYSGRFDEAAALYARAVRIVEAGAGPDAPELATLLHNLGGLEHARGDYARGEAPARRSVEIRERALGPDHPAVAADLAALAAIDDGQGRRGEAEAMYLRALRIFERAYGPGHYEVAVNLNNLAGIRHAEGRLEDAEAMYRRSLAVKERLFGPDHPDVALTLNNLGLLLADAGRLDEAAALYERALRTFEACLPHDHPKVKGCRENYEALRHKASS